METIKAFSDLQQSKKLAEILPIESADMKILPFTEREYRVVPINDIAVCGREDEIYAWSLASLFGVLPMITKGKDTANPFVAKTPDNEYYVVYATLTKEVDSSGIYDNPVDACYEMIIKLHELKVL